MSGFCTSSEVIYYDFEQLYVFMADQAFRFFVYGKAVKRRVTGSRTRAAVSQKLNCRHQGLIKSRLQTEDQGKMQPANCRLQIHNYTTC